MDRHYDLELQKLFEAVIANEISYVEKCFLEKKFHIDARDGDCNTPLLLAVYHGHFELALWILKFGARINEGNQLGITPVMAACATGNVQMLHLLVKNGGDLRVSDLGNSPLGFACAGGHIEVVKYLVSAGHDLNAMYTTTCPSHLMLAAMNGHDEIMMYFFLPSLKAAGRLTQLPEDARDVVQQLLENSNRNVPIVDIDETVPMFFDINLLTVAVVTHNRSMFDLLLELGADLTFRLKSGNTVADVARRYGFTLESHFSGSNSSVGTSSTNTFTPARSGSITESSEETVPVKRKSRRSSMGFGKPEKSLRHIRGFVSKLFRSNR